MEAINPDRFSDFLIRKNINTESFSLGEPAIFQEWKELFSQVHEESFLMLQKFRLNPLRRRFPLVKHASVHPALQPGSE